MDEVCAFGEVGVVEGFGAWGFPVFFEFEVFYLFVGHGFEEGGVEEHAWVYEGASGCLGEGVGDVFGCVGGDSLSAPFEGVLGEVDVPGCGAGDVGESFFEHGFGEVLASCFDAVLFDE